MISQKDHFKHLEIRRSVASAYNLSTLSQLEEYIDPNSLEFVAILERFAAEKRPMDASAYMQYYALDCIGELAVSLSLLPLKDER